ncbi:hypothetical protein M8C21_003391 [Ambrosia artemisiifolia]|uniref:Alcohol dehydrogenase-like C-terminal domain-containing protein n=1 Tax=Ambrosia artemisiifolia TaxID=4212 RepID=A0AAD5C2F7_AMBAR|nr:hypothetical protein M8C21_003391 [Ambrosia artemisiifolia]
MTKSPESEHPFKAYGYAAQDASGVLSPFNFSRRATGDKDVRFKVLYCGICHSDLHFIKNEWGFTTYPVIPGSCESCVNDLENYCPKQIITYGVPDLDGTRTYGGYSDHMVTDEHFVLRWPENLPLDAGAPLLCAGITTYSPLRHFGLDKPGTKVGVVGLGGLGHVAVKFAKAFGAEVTVFSTNPAKKQEALEGLKADHFVVSKDSEQMQALADIELISMDYVNTAMERVAKSDVRYRFVLDVSKSLKAP